MANSFGLVAIDVDGTLINTENRLTAATKAAIGAVQAQGTGVTLVSGRPRLTVRPLLAELDIRLPYISSGGAHIVDPVNNATLYYRSLEREHLITIIDLARAAKVSLITQEADRLFYEGNLEMLHHLSRLARIDITVADEFKFNFIHVDDISRVDSEPLKITACGEPEIVAGIEKQLRQYQLPIFMTYSAPTFLEITSIQANKGEALRRLADYLTIPLERILAIGDSRNDISMLELAGTAVAVNNAPPEVKAVTDLVAPSNDEDGVAWALDRLVLSRREGRL